MRHFPAGLLRRTTLERFIHELFTALAVEVRAVGVIARDQSHPGTVGRIVPGSLGLIADIDFTGGAADQSQAEGEGEKLTHG